MLSEISQTEEDICCIIYAVLESEIAEVIETGSRVVITKGWVLGEIGRC